MAKFQRFLASSTFVRIALLLAVWLVFGQTLGHDFVNFDDNLYVSETPQVTGGFSADGVAWAFTTSRAGNWHPLTWISLMLDGQVAGSRPWMYHLTNVLLHAAAAIVLFEALRRMTGRHWLAALVAAVFAIHPLRAESVAWISERKDVLSGLWFALGLWAYWGYASRPPSLGRYLAVVACLVLGLMSKPVLVTFPFVLLLLDYWPLRRGVKWVEKIPLFLISAAFCIVTPLAQGKAMMALERMPFDVRFPNAMVSYVIYVVQFFWPFDLAAFYPHPGPSLAVWKAIAAVAFLIGVSAAALLARRRLPALFVGWFWYLGMFVPMIGLVQVGSQAHADRYTYLPEIGLCIAVVWSLAEVLATWKRGRFWGGAASAVVLLVLMATAWAQAGYWRDSVTLWRRTLACTTDNALANMCLGAALTDRGDLEAAIGHFEEALAINPKFPEPRHSLRIALNRLGDHYGKAGQLDRAAVYYRRAIAVDPKTIDGRYNLGVALKQLGKPAEAIAQWRETIRLRPDDADAIDQLAWTLATCPDASLRNGAEAVTLAQRAVQLTHGADGQMLGTLAAAQAEVGRFADAVATADRAIAAATKQDDAATAQACRVQQGLYRAGKPYHER